MSGIIYRKIIKPVLFNFPADQVHAMVLTLGRWLGSSGIARKFIGHLFSYHNKSLHINLAGLSIKNPVGLAAGFDYDADLMRITPSIGFGFQSIGTVTLGAYRGNPRPMLGRLPKSRSLLVNKGFKSAGMQAVLKKIGKNNFEIPIGLSIGATNRRYENFNEITEEIAAGF